MDRPKPHFAVRWDERGDGTLDGCVLKTFLEGQHKLLRDGHVSRILEYVQDVGPDSPSTAYYRFKLNGVRWYAVMNRASGDCVTLYSQAFMTKKKAKRKHMKRWRSAADGPGKKARRLLARHRTEGG